MKIGGKYTMLFVEGFFIRDLSCYSDGTKRISECREGVLGDLLEEEKGGYSVLFSGRCADSSFVSKRDYREQGTFPFLSSWERLQDYRNS